MQHVFLDCFSVRSFLWFLQHGERIFWFKSTSKWLKCGCGLLRSSTIGTASKLWFFQQWKDIWNKSDYWKFHQRINFKFCNKRKKIKLVDLYVFVISFRIPEYLSRERKIFRDSRVKRPSRSSDFADNSSITSSVPTTRDPSPHRPSGSPLLTSRPIPHVATADSPGLLGPPPLPTWSSSPPVAVLGANDVSDIQSNETEDGLLNCSVSTGIHAVLSGSEEMETETSSQSYVILSPGEWVV